MAPLYAHEIHNLITSLSGRAQLALMKPDDASLTQQVLEAVVEGCARGACLSELFLSQPGAGDPEDQEELATVFDRLSRSYRLDPTGHALLRIASPPAALRPAASGIIMEQVLDNLIRNAFRAINEHPNPNDPGHSVVVRAESMNGTCSTWNTDRPTMMEIWVEDTGVGMSDGEIERMMGRSVPDHRCGIRNELYPRHGLGMRVCRMLIQSVGGTIACESEPNQGTRMIVRLPIAVADSQKVKRAA